MTISTKGDLPTRPRPSAANDQVVAQNLQASETSVPTPAPVADSESTSPRVNSAAELESRIELRRAELIGRLGELRADTRLAAAEARDRIKALLSELAHIIKRGVVDSWANLGDTVKHDLERWLADARRALTTLAPLGSDGQS